MNLQEHANRIRVIPYTEIDGIRTFKDSDLEAIYNQMVDDETFLIVFADRPDIITAGDFIGYMKQPDNTLFILKYDGDTVGVVWLNEWRGRSANMPFCTFSNIWGTGRTVPLGRVAIRQILAQKSRNGNYLLDMVWAMVPKKNMAALAFGYNVGWKTCGELPRAYFDRETGKSESATLIYYLREDNHADE